MQLVKTPVQMYRTFDGLLLLELRNWLENELERNVQLRRELLAEVEAVAPSLAEHAANSEGLARLNAPSIEALRKTRLLRFICPKERGGEEANPVTQLEIIEALAKIDGSAAWTVGILAGVSMIVAAFLPAAAAKTIFASGVPPMAGIASPRGRAQPIDGGYRVKGYLVFRERHPSCRLGSREFDCAREAFIRSGSPRRPASKSGCGSRQLAGRRIKGSASCDFSVDDVFVPEAMTFRLADMASGAAIAGGAALRVGHPALVMPFHFGSHLALHAEHWTRSRCKRSKKVAAVRLHCLPRKHSFSSHSGRPSSNSRRRAHWQSPSCRPRGNKRRRDPCRRRPCRPRCERRPVTLLRWHSA